MEFYSLSEIKKIYEEEDNLGALDDLLYSAVDAIVTNSKYAKFFYEEYPFEDGREAINRCNYDDLKECTIDTYAQYVAYSKDDEIIKEYEYSIYGSTNVEDLVEFSPYCLYELIKSVDKDFNNDFEKKPILIILNEDYLEINIKRYKMIVMKI